MKKIQLLLYAVFFILVPVHQLQAGSRTFGLGLVLGDPTGFNGKLWLRETAALNFVLAWGWGYDNYGHPYYDDRNCYDGKYYRDNKSWCDRNYYHPGNHYNPRGYHIRGDYLIHNFDVIKSNERIPVYYGPGVSIESFQDVARFGVRGNVGLAWMHRSLPFDIFLEIAPVVHILPGFYLDFTGGLGSRYYF